MSSLRVLAMALLAPALLALFTALCVAAPAAGTNPVGRDHFRGGDDLKEVLRKHSEALGGYEKIRALRCLRGEGIVRAGGLEGRSLNYAEFPRRLRQDLDLKVVKLTEVLDDTVAWQRDPNGQLKKLDAEERRQLVSESCFGSLAYLTAPDSLVHVSLSRDPSDSSRYVTLEVEPRDGVKVRLAISPENWLVAKMMMSVAAGEVAIYFSDYRPVAGVMTAFHLEQVISGDQAHAITTDIVRAESVETLPDTLWRYPEQAARDWSLPGGRVSLALPIQVHAHHVTVQARINGRGPFDFLLDTGAGTTTLDKAFAAGIGLASQGRLGVQGVGGAADFGFVQVDSFDVGGAVMRGQRAVTVDLSAIKESIGEGLAGILGYDFISRFAVTLDYPGRTLELWDPGAFTPPSGARELPIQLMQNIPIVEATFGNGPSGRFMLDTGNNGSLLLHGAFVRAHDLVHRAPKKLQGQMRGAGGLEPNYITRGDSLSLGGFTVMRPLAELSTSDAGITGGSGDIAGNIGGRVLEKFTLTLDYARRRIFLAPNAQFPEEMVYDRLGWVLEPRDSALVVSEVQPDSPAALAGVEPGDRVMTIDDRSLSGLRPVDVREFAGRPAGTTIRLKLNRKNRILMVDVKLEDMI